MSRKFAVSLDLNKNELLNARIQNLSSDPSSPVVGQIYYNTQDKETRVWDGSQWIAGGSVKYGTTSQRPASTKGGIIYLDTTTSTLYLDNGISWVQIGVNPDDLEARIEEYNTFHDVSSGVHGVTGDIVGTSDTQILSNKTISDSLHFNAGDGNAGIIRDNDDHELDIFAENNVRLAAENNVFISTNNGNIILEADGAAYIGSAQTNNQIATIGDLNSGQVVQSVSGTTHQVKATTNSDGAVELSLPNDVAVVSSLEVGADYVNEAFSDGLFRVKKTDGSDIFIADATENITVINSNIQIQDGNGSALIDISKSFTGTARITTGDDLALRSNDGDIILYPGNDNGGTGKAYVHWGNDATEAFPEHEITTAGNTQFITNKIIADELGFVNPSTAGTDAGIVVNDTNEHFQIKSYTSDLDIITTAGDINLLPEGSVNIDASVYLNGTLITPVINGSLGGPYDGGLTLQDGSQSSQIEINGITKDIKLLPAEGSKAFYGSAATAGNEIATIADVQALATGLSWKQSVNLFSNSNIALSGTANGFISSPPTSTFYIDGHPIGLYGSTVVGDGYRVLLVGQDDSDENGIYDVSVNSEGDYALTRSADADTVAELLGAALFVMEGNQYGSTSWVESADYASTFGGIQWVQFSGTGTFIGSNSIVINGREINVIADTSRGLAIDGDGVYVKTGQGIEIDVVGQVALAVGTGLTVGSGSLEFASGYGVRKYAISIGDNTTTSWDVLHEFDTKDVTVTVYDNSTDEEVFTDVRHYANKVTITSASIISTDQYRVVVVG